MTKMYFEVGETLFGTLKEAYSFMKSIGSKEEPKAVFEEIGEKYYSLDEFVKENK